MFGRMYSETWARIACLIIFCGFNLTFFPQFILGTQGMPRRYARYLEQYQHLHQMSTIGSLILGVGLFVCGFVLLHSLLKGKAAPRNPWGSPSLEWQTSSPPGPHNFESTPVAGDPYDYDQLVYSADEQGYVKTEEPSATAV
jgi:cytochrome c oxidase subunit 1